MTSGWNLEKIKASLLAIWHPVPQSERPCAVCSSLQRVSTWNSVPDKGGVLFSTTTASLKASATKCTVCEAFYVALTKYPWPLERPSSRILLQNNDQNQVIVSGDGKTLGMMIVSHLSADIVSPTLYMYAKNKCANQIPEYAMAANIQQVIDYHGRILLLSTLSPSVSLPKPISDFCING